MMTISFLFSFFSRCQHVRSQQQVKHQLHDMNYAAAVMRETNMIMDCSSLLFLRSELEKSYSFSWKDEMLGDSLSESGDIGEYE